MLNERLSGYLNYFESLAMQPTNRWSGFYLTEQETRHFALRFQIAFSCYALGLLCLHPDTTDNDKRRCLDAMAALIDRMLQRRVWAYWAIEAERNGLNPNPVQKANIQYSANLAMMMGMYEAVGGDSRYDEAFTILWTSSEQFSSNHNSLAYEVWQQMYENPHHGIDNAPGRTETIHMNHALWSNALHDCLHGSQFRDINTQWLNFLQQRMRIRGPRIPGRGVFAALYLSHLRLPLTISTNLSDAWTLALLAPLQPELVQQVTPRFLRCVRRPQKSEVKTLPPDQATSAASIGAQVGESYIPSASRWRSMEISDPSLTTGFAFLLAVHQGDTVLATEFLNYADNHFQPVEHEGKRSYQGETVAPLTTALFAMGEAGGMHALAEIASGERTVQVVPPPPEPDEAAEQGESEGESEGEGETTAS